MDAGCGDPGGKGTGTGAGCPALGTGAVAFAAMTGCGGPPESEEPVTVKLPCLGGPDAVEAFTADPCHDQGKPDLTLPGTGGGCGHDSGIAAFTAGCQPPSPAPCPPLPGGLGFMAAACGQGAGPEILFHP